MKYLKRAIPVLLLGAMSPSYAGVYIDDLSKCLVESTTTQDRVALVRWMFLAISAHPAVTSLAQTSKGEVDKANSEVGALFLRLLTETCVEKSKKAIKYEGPAAIQLSFQVLGQVAGMEMFSNPDVAKFMTGLEKHLDPSKLEALKN